MVIALLGASGAGKSRIEKELATHHGYRKIISYTTRLPRVEEVNGKDYHFTNNETFNQMLKDGHFAEHEEYSQNRLYGTVKYDYVQGDNAVVVLTPNGLRQLKKELSDENIFSVLVEASLGTRIKRYVDRCGVDKFNFDDKNEIAARVERDFGAFMGVENEVDFVVNNDEGTDIGELATLIIESSMK